MSRKAGRRSRWALAAAARRQRVDALDVAAVVFVGSRSRTASPPRRASSPPHGGPRAACRRRSRCPRRRTATGSRNSAAALRLSQNTPESVAPSPKNATAVRPLFSRRLAKAAADRDGDLRGDDAARQHVPLLGSARVHRSALAFAGTRGPAIELREEQVGVVRLRQERGMAAIGRKDVGLALERRADPDGHEFLPHRHVHRRAHRILGIMLDDVLFGPSGQEKAPEQLYRRGFGEGLAGKTHRECRCLRVVRTIETSDSQGNVAVAARRAPGWPFAVASIK